MLICFMEFCKFAYTLFHAEFRLNIKMLDLFLAKYFGLIVVAKYEHVTKHLKFLCVELFLFDLSNEVVAVHDRLSKGYESD